MNEEKMLDVLAQIQCLKNKRDLQVDTYNARIKTLSDYLENNMAVSSVLKLVGPTATAYYRQNTNIKVVNWPAFMQYVEEHKAMDMLQKRVSPKAVELRLGAGEKIKGVTVEKTETFVIRSGKGGEDETE